jgi:hypothetical protein
MTLLRDETLIAYADNQLSGDARRAVEHVLAVDSEARHMVALLRLSAWHVREVFDAIDFSGVPVWLDALLGRDGTSRTDGRQPGARRVRQWPKLGFALAACLVLGLSIGSVATVERSGHDHEQKLAVLGEVPRSSILAEALDHVVETGGAWTGPDRWRAAEVARFRDRFGKECREVELFSAREGDIPAQVLIACRGATHRWTVVGAVANEVSEAPVYAHYVASEDEARSSLDSILSLLGAQQRTTAAERKTMTP